MRPPPARIGLTSLVSTVALIALFGIAITIGFGVPRPTAVLAVLGYRIVNYWLPLIPGAVAYLRLRLHRSAGHAQPQPSAQSL